MSTSSPVTLRTTSGPVTNTRLSGAITTTSVSAGPEAGAPAGETDDHRDLRNVARRADHGLEHRSDRVQRPDTFCQPGATGVPDADDRALLLDRGVVGVHDVRGAFGAHGA